MRVGRLSVVFYARARLGASVRSARDRSLGRATTRHPRPRVGGTGGTATRPGREQAAGSGTGGAHLLEGAAAPASAADPRARGRSGTGGPARAADEQRRQTGAGGGGSSGAIDAGGSARQATAADPRSARSKTAARTVRCPALPAAESADRVRDASRSVPDARRHAHHHEGPVALSPRRDQGAGRAVRIGPEAGRGARGRQRRARPGTRCRSP